MTTSCLTLASHKLLSACFISQSSVELLVVMLTFWVSCFLNSAYSKGGSCIVHTPHICPWGLCQVPHIPASPPFTLLRLHSQALTQGGPHPQGLVDANHGGLARGVRGGGGQASQGKVALRGGGAPKMYAWGGPGYAVAGWESDQAAVDCQSKDL